MERVIAARSQYLSPTHGSVGQAKAELGATYFLGVTPDYQKADTLLAEAQEIIANSYGTSSGRLADVFQYRARIQLKFGNQQQALPLFETAESIYFESNPVSFQRTQNLRELAELHAALGNEQAAARSASAWKT